MWLPLDCIMKKRYVGGLYTELFMLSALLVSLLIAIRYPYMFLMFLLLVNVTFFSGDQKIKCC